MSTTRLFVKMQFVEGALIRLLGLAGRRGFDIARVEARRTDGGKVYEVMMELAGPRCVLTLQRQIAKLYDVQTVEIVPALYDTPPLRIAPDVALPRPSLATPIVGELAV